MKKYSELLRHVNHLEHRYDAIRADEFKADCAESMEAFAINSDAYFYLMNRLENAKYSGDLFESIRDYREHASALTCKASELSQSEWESYCDRHINQIYGAILFAYDHKLISEDQWLELDASLNDAYREVCRQVWPDE